MTRPSSDQPASPGTSGGVPVPPRKAQAPPSAIPAGDPILDPPPPRPAARKSRSVAWITVTITALVLALLIVLLLQNTTRVGIHFFGWFGTISLGIALMFAALAAAAIVAIPAGIRILQLRRRR
jgi:uncharacterized integral membrane protein